MSISFRTLVPVVCVYGLFVGMLFAYVHKDTQAKHILEVHENKRDVREPQAIDIPAIHLHKRVVAGEYDFSQNNWSISKEYAHFAVLSEVPNALEGTTVIYAHNSSELFGDIGELKKNDMVFLKTKIGKTFAYTYSHSEDVNPMDVSVFTGQGPSKLTLITCTGKNNSMRKLIYLDFVSEY